MKFFRVRPGRKKGKPIPFRKIVPNMVTSGNLLCGMFSLILAYHGRYIPAAWMIFFAVLFDGLDGKVARSLGGGSQFGLEYDSLADLVSFGVAPGMMMYMAALADFGGIVGAIVACFYTLCVALRLARFNVVHVPGPFQGLPSPAGGLFVASFTLARLPHEPLLVALLLTFSGLLMVSSIPYANLKKLTRETADRKKCVLTLLFLTALVVLFRSAAPLIFFSVYILSGFLRFDWGEWLLLPEENALEDHVH
ncbi:MAG: CDP-diacylglycerol--serine O-phosphatidyltransferase [Synergistaceae bacterium]|jgi:CDP-diacylglycerol--serine O-phosphatidyltransferase|nr:CDP-diacylglycerol--serine O-phosphatidyltransferase [Synergistaceae bacterium]